MPKWGKEKVLVSLGSVGAGSDRRSIAIAMPKMLVASAAPSLPNFSFVLQQHSLDRNSSSQSRPTSVTLVRAFFGGGKSSKGCSKCKGKGALECEGCKGTGKNKQNGNIFERWKCYDCQGFGLVSCPNCGRGGLTPEQRGER